MDSLTEQAAMLALHGNTPLPLANATPLSDVRIFFESKAFKDYTKQQENRSKTISTLFDRLNNIVKAINALGGGRRR
ncbi:hypothetical protein [Comamonas sp. HJ-2]